MPAEARRVRAGHVWACGLALALTLTLCAHGLSAQAAPGRRPSLQWTRSAGAEACIDPQSLAQRVEALTGPRLVAPRDADYSIEGHVAPRAGPGFTAVLRIAVEGQAPRGLRTLEHVSADCRGFDQALAFVIALMIDPELDLDGLLGDQPTPEPGPALLAELPEPSAPPTQIPEGLAHTRREPAPEVGTVRGPRIALAGAVSLAAADAPSFSLGGQLALALLLNRRLAVAVSARGDSATPPIALEDSLRVRASRVAFALLGCARAPLGAQLEFTLCVGPEPELWLARGDGFIAAARARQWSMGGLLQAEFAYALSARSACTLAGLGRLNFMRPRFDYEVFSGTRDALNAGIFRAGVLLGLRVLLDSV